MVDEMSWLEITIVCDGELAEAVSEVLARYVTQGVVTETDVKYDDAEEIPLAYGPIRVFGYLENDDTVEEKRRMIEEGLWHLSQIQPVPAPTYRVIANQNWMESWKQHYQPIQIGEKLLILPAWLENPYPERIAVKIDPSMAFGTGTHPTTQLCMALAETVIQPGDRIIDVGCGSGILSIAAIKLGAEKALGVDLDQPSIVATKKNAEANDVGEQVEAGEGSVAEILAGQFSIKSAQVVMANILAPIIIRLFGHGLGDLVQPYGFLILSGILDRQEAEVRAATEAEGFVFIERRLIKDWVALKFKKA
ncbi:MAG: 50S ribosomal protein L11 methyltransferase [Chloroflexi bacterium HGW-Chloroflexi-10]|nr:MAG: 50S ribosomal protein L11 methyltransferase [Chloroflexi bacterium HGW-Chloroflexi-10]